MRQSPEQGEFSGIRSLYFLCYMAWGALSPFLNIHYRRLGLSGIQIGSLSALTVVVGSISSLFWSGISDIFGLRRVIFLCAIAATIWPVLMLSRAVGYPVIVLWATLLAFLGSPISPLLDSTAVAATSEVTGGYGRLRVWGTAGWAISTILTGEAIRSFSLRWAFYGYILFMSLAFLGALRAPLPGHPRSSGARRALVPFLQQPRFALFLASVSLLGITLGAGSNFLSLYLEDLGATEMMVGLAWTLGAATEIPMMLGSRRLVSRLGSHGLLVLAFVLFSMRWFLLSLVPSPEWALVIQTLHGVSFAAFLVGGVLVTTSFAPPELSTVTLAAFNTVAFGGSSIIGALVGGHIHDTFGLRVLFRILGGVALAGLGVLALFERDSRSGKGRLG